MDYSNIFTTYNSVDPIVYTNIPNPTPSNIKMKSPLQELLFKLEQNQTLKKVQEDPKNSKLEDIDYSYLDKYHLKEQAPQNKPIENNQITSFKNQQDFINTMKPIYQKVLSEKGIDTSYADYLVAQSALESGWGKHQAGKFNLGGIKVPSKQRGKGLGTVRKTREVINGQNKYIEDEFRNFNDLEDYARFHVNLLNNMNYQAFKGDFINNVVRGGYATDPKYKQVLQNMYNQIRNNYG